MTIQKRLALLLLYSTNCFPIEPPDGWRFPTRNELSEKSLRNSSPTKCTNVVGDLNNDNRTDQAFLFKSTEFNGEGLLVYLSSPSGYVWKVLNKTNCGKEYPSVKLAMGIDSAEPGMYKTACGKGHWECGPNESETLILEAPGIWHFTFESAESIWYWDKNSDEFRQIFISD